MESVYGIILKVKNQTLGDTSSIEILGKSMLDWVKLSLGEETTAVAVDYDERVEVPSQAKHFADSGKKYTAVLFSDTPLITKKTVTDAVAVAENGGLNVVKMTRGYIFRTAFLMSCEKLYTDNTHYFTEEDFLTASTPHNLALITDVMRNRILRYHADRGVRFTDLGTTVVEGDVVIAPGVIRWKVISHEFNGNADALVLTGLVDLQRILHYMENIQSYKEIAAQPQQKVTAIL